MPQSSRQFFTTKPRAIMYTCLELYHPAFGYKRYVGNQFVEKTLGGVVYTPASMQITESVQDSTNTIVYDVNLGRVGSQGKQLVKAVSNWPLGWVIGVQATVRYFLSTDVTTPFRPEVVLSVGTLAMDGQDLMISLDGANPRSQSVARRYSGAEFPGTSAQV